MTFGKITFGNGDVFCKTGTPVSAARPAADCRVPGAVSHFSRQHTLSANAATGKAGMGKEERKLFLTYR